MVGTLMENPKVCSLLNLTKLFDFRSWNYQFITTLIAVDSKVKYLCYNNKSHAPRLGDPGPTGNPSTLRMRSMILPWQQCATCITPRRLGDCTNT